ncbi:MAG: hypothetical protein Q9180_007809, partial [Flavoplaca navasiana]
IWPSKPDFSYLPISQTALPISIPFNYPDPKVDTLCKMTAIKWKQHKSAKLQAPKPTTTVETRIEAATTKKKGRQAQKWLDKCYRKMDSTKKARTERGEERPEADTAEKPSPTSAKPKAT